MTGAELKHARISLSKALDERLSIADMAMLCGLADPTGNGKDTMRKWEQGDGPSGPVATLLSLLVDGLSLDDSEVQVFFLEYIRDRLGIVPI